MDVNKIQAPVQQTYSQNPTRSANTAEVIRKTDEKIEPTASKVPNPDYNKSPAQVNKSFELRQDPPTTVLKFTNEATKQVELQIPSEVQIGIYKDMQKFIDNQNSKREVEKPQNSVNIRI